MLAGRPTSRFSADPDVRVTCVTGAPHGSGYIAESRRKGKSMIKMFRWGLAGAVLTTVAAPALAQDRCGDILKNGVFDTLDTSSRSEYQEIIISRFLASTYEGSKRSDSGINGKSIGEMVMGGAYSRSEFDQKKSMIKQSYDRTLTQIEEWNLATRTANGAIISAWEKCVDGRSGLFARFETQPGDGRNVTLVLTVSGAMGINDVILASDTTIPSEAQVLSQNQYNKCLKAGAKITHSAPCRIALQMPASKPLKMIISAVAGDAEAYLGKRLRWKQSRKPFTHVIDYTLGPNQFSGQSGLIQFPAADIEAGFTFATGSVEFTGPTRYYGSGDGYCRNFKTKPSATSIAWTLDVYSTDNMSTACRVVLQAALEKGEFVPDE